MYPKYLDSKGLMTLCREALWAKNVMEEKKSIQLFIIDAVQSIIFMEQQQYTIGTGVQAHFKHFLNIDGDDLLSFMKCFKYRQLKKGDSFIEEGGKANEIGFVLKGCMVCLYNKDGVNVIDEFAMENEFIADYTCALDNKPAEKKVKCIEDTELLVISIKDLHRLYTQSQVFERVGRLMAEALFKNWHNKAVSLMLDDAETRYKKLVIERPSLAQRVPQYMIASYLRVTPESLSRIRKKS
ncbi:Crp/Fnr family transcriptional regulator [Carboxylicivirga sp. M1479]|uniref:Crp/Fnr family transcriptional regulator n=1 Tax=Carboxylicivirga sp. M1479 TaxID=2594476 RepID=UPI0011780F64|nr:Crp/Fnr family transcriptional regulator [Carboxylicivirga sp. M1479]TRX66553.1 Crp/Fnr family transcriptional regulator [Carboxylicivirga sp. M1479]